MSLPRTCCESTGSSRFDQLPGRKFDAGYGGIEGPVILAFSEKYVYVKGVYDGAEWIAPVPRNPDAVTGELPVIGGG